MVAISIKETRSAGALLGWLCVLVLKQGENTDESLDTVCSIWHVNVDTLPEWILTSVHQVRVSALTEMCALLNDVDDDVSLTISDHPMLIHSLRVF